MNRRDLEKHDARYCGSNIRLLEMYVDEVTGFVLGPSMQFWADFQTYSLSEAVNYLKSNCPDANYAKLDALVAKLETKVKSMR